MGYIRGEAREQTKMFPVTLEELIPADHMCRVIEALVNRLNMAKLGFLRAEAADNGRPGYDPRDLLKLYLYGYLGRNDFAPAYNVQTAVDTEHALIVAQKVTSKATIKIVYCLWRKRPSRRWGIQPR